TGDNFNIDSRFSFYLRDDRGAISCVAHCTRSTCAVMFHLVNLHQTAEYTHTIDHHLLSVGTDFAMRKNIHAESQWNPQKIKLRKFWLAFFRFFYFVDEQTCGVTTDIYGCNNHYYLRLQVSVVFK